MALMNIRQDGTQSSELHTLQCVDLGILDVYARVSGIQQLCMHVMKNSTISQQFTLPLESHTRVSVRFVAHHILAMASQIRLRYTLMTNSIIEYPTESLVLFQESRKISKFAVRCKHYRNERPCTKIEEDISYSTNDKLSELLMKYSIHCFTAFHLAENNIRFIFNDKCEVFSHYKALYLFQKKEYQKAMKICDEVLKKEMPANSVAPNFISETRFQHFVPVPVTLAFQILFSNDITSLLGIMTLIHGNFAISTTPESILGDMEALRDSDISPYLDDVFAYTGGLITEWPTKGSAQIMFNYFGTKVKEFLTVISPQFLVLYLRAECIIHMNYSRRDRLEALKALKFGNCVLVFERIMSLLLRRKYFRLNISRLE